MEGEREEENEKENEKENGAKGEEKDGSKSKDGNEEEYVDMWKIGACVDGREILDGREYWMRQLYLLQY